MLMGTHSAFVMAGQFSMWAHSVPVAPPFRWTTPWSATKVVYTLCITLRYVTSQQSSWQRQPPVSLLSQGSSHFMMRCSICDLPTGRTKQDWMWEQATFGAKDRRPFSTLGFSTRSPPPAVKSTSSLSTECTNWKETGVCWERARSWAWSLHPLIFASTGGMARECIICFKRIADILSDRKKMSFSQVLYLIRCCISSALLRSAIRAIRGSQQSRRSAGDCGMDFNRAYTEGHLGPWTCESA